MTYFCFIETEIQTVPHMEPLTAEELDDAKTEAARLLAQHASEYVAHVYEDDERVATITPDMPLRPAPALTAWQG